MVFSNNQIPAFRPRVMNTLSQRMLLLCLSLLFLGGVSSASAKGGAPNERINPTGTKHPAKSSPQQDAVQEKSVQNKNVKNSSSPSSPSPALPEKSSSPSKMARKWLSRIGRYRSANPRGKYPDPVKEAFATVVASARQSMVRILLDDSDAILGTIVSSDGYVVTKASELSDKSNLVCQLKDGRQLKAQIVDTNRKHDLALLKINAGGLSAISWAENDSPQVGSWLATPGLGESSLAIGVVSIAPRKIPSASGILGIKMDHTESGPRVSMVFPGSGAEKADVRVDDIILRVNEEVTETMHKLGKTISSYYPGDKVKLHLQRGGKEMDLSAILGSRFPGLHMDQSDFQNHLGGRISERRAGFPRVIQHDTVLKPSDCGGPIVNLDGKAIGINIARAGRVACYALPASEIKEFIDELISAKIDSLSVNQDVKR